MPWWVWAIAAAILAMAEMYLPGTYLVWIAVGAAVTTGAVALYDMPMAWQLGLFAAASAASCGAGYRVYRRADRRRDQGGPLNQRSLMMVGQCGVVAADIVNGQGKVRLGDTVWLAEGPDMPKGTAVTVRSVHGAWVRVVPMAASSEEPRDSMPGSAGNPVV
jgi:membrane protein implicated in regulation of membrane protease activity